MKQHKINIFELLPFDTVLLVLKTNEDTMAPLALLPDRTTCHVTENPEGKLNILSGGEYKKFSNDPSFANAKAFYDKLGDNPVFFSTVGPTKAERRDNGENMVEALKAYGFYVKCNPMSPLEEITRTMESQKLPPCAFAEESSGRTCIAILMGSSTVHAVKFSVDLVIIDYVSATYNSERQIVDFLKRHHNPLREFILVVGAPTCIKNLPFPGTLPHSSIAYATEWTSMTISNLIKSAEDPTHGLGKRGENCISMLKTVHKTLDDLHKENASVNAFRLAASATTWEQAAQILWDYDPAFMFTNANAARANFEMHPKFKKKYV